MRLNIESPAFKQDSFIPVQYTCEGKNISPALAWSVVPEETKSFALIMDDPDAPGGDWVHWVLYNLPKDVLQLEEGIAPNETLPNGIKQGINDFRKIGYGGPCPPPGKPHRYFFKLYALNVALQLPPQTTKAQLLKAMTNHVLAEAHLMGKYQRSR